MQKLTITKLKVW